MKEIEKKFLVKDIDLTKYKYIDITQAYLNTTNPTIRVRKYGNDYFLTYKRKIKTDKNLKIHDEYELPITENVFNKLLKKTEGNIINKRRYIIDLDNNLKAELDVYFDNLEGLKTVEVEFKTEKDSLFFKKPDWFLEDVTTNKNYTNSSLAMLNNLKDLKEKDMLGKILIATSNKGKIKEFEEIFKDFEILSLKDIEKLLNKKINIDENKNTFKENALEKARGLYNQVGEDYICIADDSGISIDALDGFPGVHTARWMDADDHTKNLCLLEKLKDIKKEDRKCHYTTVIALKYRNIEKIFEYTLDGIVSTNTRGDNGFGFDEIFELKNGKTLAEISIDEKNKISPRKKDLDQLREYLKTKNT